MHIALAPPQAGLIVYRDRVVEVIVEKAVPYEVISSTSR